MDVSILCTYRIIISAPNGTTPGGAVPNTGLIFTCPVQPGNCVGLMGDGQGVDNRLFDAEGTQGESTCTF